MSLGVEDSTAKLTPCVKGQKNENNSNKIDFPQSELQPINDNATALNTNFFS